MSYFQRHYHLFQYPFALKGDVGFRPAQLGAIHAVAGHFGQRHEPAIVTMPTGSGKTGVMIACPFVLRATRVLIVTPSRLVREQIAEEVAELALLRKLGALPDEVERPRVCSVGKRITTSTRWQELAECDVVVGTVQSISPALETVATPESDQFDLVLVDEAHHSSAQTWQALLDCFPRAQRVLFTATPFRRDGREIRGRFVFTYELRQAHRDGVFGRIRYEPVEERGDELRRDIAVAKATEAQLQADRDSGLDHLVMVRTDRKARADELAAIYVEHTGLRLASLNSNHSLRHAKGVLKKLRGGELDGIITINMFGEGFDFPQLKIAAVHAPHKSLAATLQFIGRFTRTSGENLGMATFLAIPDDIEIERQHLFEVGAGWQDIIENLSADQIKKEVKTREVLESFEPVDQPLPDFSDLSLYALEPYHHVKIYRAAGEIDLNATIDFPDDMVVVYRVVSPVQHAAVWITRERSGVRWCNDGRIVDVRHHLFVVHYDETSRLLFICASLRAAGLYEQLARQLMTGEPRILPLARINRALNGLEGLEFYNVGLRNRVMGNRTESYRIITGPSAAQAILPSDARLFHRGHCYGSAEDGDARITIGLSSASKVWSNRSSQLPELIAWCAELARRIEADRMPLTASGLDHLSAGEEIDRLPPGIFCANWDSRVYKSPLRVRFRQGDVDYERQLLDFDVEIDHEQSTDDCIVFRLCSESITYHATFSLEIIRLFEPASDSEPHIAVILGARESPLIDFLNEHPLSFYTENLSLVRAFDLYRASDAGSLPFDANQIEMVNWTDAKVDPGLEYGPTGDNGCSVHTFLEARLAASAADVVYYDHGSGEVADFLTLTLRDSRVIVELFHCKGAHSGKAADRVDDAYEVCGQAVKSVIHADPTLLLHQIKGRWDRRTGSCRFVKGSLEEFRSILDSHSRIAFQFEIVVVQPGIGRNLLSPKIANLLAATNDHLVRGGFSPLRVIGS
jgi:superfamily II DNA or RNA helicase